MKTNQSLGIYEFIEDYIKDKGYPPTIREIGDNLGIKSTSVVSYNLDILEKMKCIHRDAKVSRGIKLLKSPAKPLPLPEPF